MRLARAVGLQAVNAEIGNVEGIDYLLVERYDRAVSANSKSLKREHQEDFCQALGIVPEHKYQSEGGPSLKQCFELVRATSATPVIDLQSLLDAVIFNWLIGNHDAHGKNFSLLYRGEIASGLQTSPTWRIQPPAQLFLRRKSLISGLGDPPQGAKLAVVKTYPVPKGAPMCIIGSRYVPALHDAKEKRQGAPLLQPGGKPAGGQRAGGATLRSVPGRDQRQPTRGLAQDHRDF
jgi:hypothetical protein